MKLKLRYKFMFTLILVLTLLFVYYYIRINSVVRENYKRYLSGQILRAGKIVNNSLENLRHNKQQNIQAFANLPELNNAIDNDLIFKIPFILKKHLSDYQLDNIQIYNRNGSLLGETGSEFKTESTTLIRRMIKAKIFSNLYIRKNRLIILSSALTPGGKALVVGKFIIGGKSIKNIKDLVGLDLAFLKRGIVFSSTISPKTPPLSTWSHNSNIILNSLLGQNETRFYSKKKILLLYQPLENHTKHIIASTLLIMKGDLLTYTEKDSTRTLINILIGGFFLAIIVSIIFSAQITKHINQITKWALEIRKDNLGKPITIRSHDEIADLAKVINQMMLNLKNSFDQIHTQNEQLKRLDKIKTDLITTISHEMRTPITTLYGSIEILKDGDVEQEDQVRLFYRSMFSNIKLLKKMVNNFILFSTGDSHQPDIKPIAVNSFVEKFRKTELDGELKEKIEALNLNIEISLPDQKIQILSDKTFFQALFYELIHNAILYNKKNGKIKISFIPDSIQNKVKLVVEDSGMGIPQEALPNIFDRFYRAIDYHDSSLPGIGLGLSLVSLICEKLKLSVQVESRKNEFTRVTVSRIPYKIIPESKLS